MRRPLSLAAATAALVPLLAAAAGPVLADEVTGTDAQYGEFTPWLVALLLVTAVVLTVAAIVAYSLRRQAEALKGSGTPVAWWTCRQCAQLNSADREACFNCHAGRPLQDPVARPQDPAARPHDPAP
jgi:hypothetical protein